MRKTHIHPQDLKVEELETRTAPDVNPLLPIPNTASLISNIAVVRQQLGVFLPPAAVQALRDAARRTGEVIFVDAAIPDLPVLLSGIDRPAAVFVLDSNHDGFRQIASDLAGMDNVRAIHLVAHGKPGELLLGNTILNQANIETYAAEFQAIRATLAPGADLLVYGCDVAAGSVGEAFVDALAAGTGANVAASTNLTGVGGDWKLETATGPIEAIVPFARAALTEYQGTLGIVQGWGLNDYGQTAAQSDLIAIAAGYGLSVALKSDGGVIAWGWNFNGQQTIPLDAQSGVTAIASGAWHILALKSGRVIAWGFNGNGQTDVPSAAWSGVTSIAAGYAHSLAVANGAVVAWGNNNYSLMTVPSEAQSGVISVAAGFDYSLALTTTGRVVAWGNNPYGQTNVPGSAQSGVVAIAAGFGNSVALLANGCVVAWGADWTGMNNVPSAAQSDVVAISAGYYHCMALKSDGTVVIWGSDDSGDTVVPPALPHVGAIAAGLNFSLVLNDNRAPILDANAQPSLTSIEANPSVNPGNTVAEIVVDGSITDPDSAPVKAIAVTAVDNTIGHWEYSTDDGATWLPFTATTGQIVDFASHARLLNPQDKVRFVPDSSGGATFTFRAWDRTSGTAGGVFDTTTNGGVTAFSSATNTATITVTNAPMHAGELTPPRAFQGVPFSNQVAFHFTDENTLATADDFTAIVTWGDGGVGDGQIVASGDGFDVLVSHTYYNEAGTNLTFTIEVQDTGGQTISDSAMFTVANPLSAGVVSFTATEGEWFSGAVTTFTDAKPISMESDYTATIYWGDGDNSPGMISQVAEGTYTVSGDHPYRVEGRYYVTVQIQEQGGAIAVAHGIATWRTDLAPLPAPQTGLQTVTAENGRIYAMTGSSLFVYDPFKNTWSPLADTPTPVEHFAAMQGPDGRIYLVNADPVDLGAGLVHTVQAFDPQTGVWQTCAALPSDAIGELALATTSGGGLYALANATMYEYTPWSDSWSEVDPGTVLTQLNAVTPQRGQVWDLLAEELGGLPTPRTNFTVIVGADGRLYTIGGHTSDGLSGVVEAYDAGSATWTQLASMPTPRDGFVAVLAPDGCIYTIGGDTGVVEAYDPVTNVWWIPSDPMPVPRHDFAAAVGINGPIYLLGGSDATGALATVDALLPPILVSERGLIDLYGENVWAVEGDRFTQNVAYFQDPAGPLDPLMDHYQATIDWGDGRTSAGTINYDGWSLSVVGTHRYSQAGSYTITTNITHHAYVADPVTSTATVTEADPTHVKGVNVSAAAGERLVNVPVATFRDPTGPDFPISDHYRAEIYWADNGDITTGQIAYDAETGKFTVTGNHRYSSAGYYEIYTTIIHDETEAYAFSQAAISSVYRVRGVDVNAVEGVKFNDVPVATFRADGDDPSMYRARIDWGDGESNIGFVTFDYDRWRFVVIGSHKYAQEGSYTVTTKITDLNVGYKTEATSVATVAGMVPGAVWFEATEGVPFSGGVTTFTDANPHSRREDFTAIINWGDGSSSPGTIGRRPDGAFTVLGDHTYAKAGPYFVTVQIQDPGGATIVARGAVAWSSMPSMLTALEVPQVLVGPDGRIYAIGGYDSSGTWSDALASYMPGDLAWTALASVPRTRQEFVALMGGDGRIYVLGGRAPDGELSRTVQIYNPVDNTWTTGARMRQAREGFAAVVDANGSIYALAGWDVDGNWTDTVQIYNPATDSWTTGAHLPRTRVDFRAIVGPDGLVYVLGGLDPNDYLATNTVQVYDPATGKWDILNPMPRTRDLYGAAAVVGPDGRIYVIGGLDPDDGNPTRTLQVYDPVTHTWSVLPHMPTARALFGVTVGGADDPRIFVIGGYDWNSGELATVEAYDPVFRTWSKLPPLETPRYYLGTVLGSDGRIHAVGGRASGIPGLDVVEALTVTPILVAAAPVPPEPPEPPVPARATTFEVPVFPPPIAPVTMPGFGVSPVGMPGWVDPLRGLAPGATGVGSGLPYYSTVNPALTLRLPGEFPAHYGELVEFTAMAVFSDGNPAENPAFALLPIAGYRFPTGATIDSRTGIFSWWPSTEHEPGRYEFLVRVTDGPLSEVQRVVLVLVGTDVAGILYGVPAEAVVPADEAFTFRARVLPERGHENAAYHLEGAPEGARIDPASGVFMWVPSARQTGTHTFTVQTRAGDQGYEQVVRLIVLAAAAGPVVFPPAPAASDAAKKQVS